MLFPLAMPVCFQNTPDKKKIGNLELIHRTSSAHFLSSMWTVLKIMVYDNNEILHSHVWHYFLILFGHG